MPHEQRDQLAPASMVERLARRVYAFPDLEKRPTLVSAPGARALWLRSEAGRGSADMFLRGRELGHFHPWDGSMHIALPPETWRDVVDAGWGEQHPIAKYGVVAENVVMLYGPRTEEEVEIIYRIIARAYERAGGRGAP